MEKVRQDYWNSADESYHQIHDPKTNEVLSADMRSLVKEQVTDPATAEKLTPKYPFWCKRVAVANDYWPAFNRPNVSLVTTPIERINAGGISTSDGNQHDLDA